MNQSKSTKKSSMTEVTVRWSPTLKEVYQLWGVLAVVGAVRQGSSYNRGYAENDRDNNDKMVECGKVYRDEVILVTRVHRT